MIRRGGGSRVAVPMLVPEESHGPKIWLISFTDIMAQMLAFFVLSYAMTEPSRDQFAELASALRGERASFSGPPHKMGEVDGDLTLPRLRAVPGLEVGYLVPAFTQLRDGSPLLANLQIEAQGRNVELILPLSNLLRAGEMDVARAQQARVTALADLLRGVPNAIELRITPPSADSAAVVVALAQGQGIAHALRQAGLAGEVPILVEPVTADRPPGLLVVRVTRFRATAN